MKNMIKTCGIIACVAVIGFMMGACSDDSGGEDFGAIAASRISFVQGSYELIIEKTAERSAFRAAESFTPVNGDSYTLMNGSNRISWGKVTVGTSTGAAFGSTGTTALTFTPDEGAGGEANKFTANYAVTSGEAGLNITSPVKDKDGAAVTGLNTMRPMSWGPNGLWKAEGTHYEPGYGNFHYTCTINVTGTFTSGNYTWRLTVEGDTDEPISGSYTAVGNTFVATYRGSTVATAYLINANTMSVTDVEYGTHVFERQ